MNKWSEKARDKIILPEKLNHKIQEIRSQNKSIATLNGSFDLLHAGHLQIIYEASQLADVLIIALNSDSSIQQYKKLGRPIIPLKYRMEMMAAVEFVNYIIWFHETTPLTILEIIQPDFHVNGSEYGENCVEADIVRKYGGEIHIVNLLPGLSTSKIIDKIKTCD